MTRLVIVAVAVLLVLAGLTWKHWPHTCRGCGAEFPTDEALAEHQHRAHLS